MLMNNVLPSGLYSTYIFPSMKYTLTLLLLSLFTLSFGQPPPLWENKVSRPLLERAADGGSHPMIIILSEQEDLSKVNSMDTKEEKGRYAYQQLRSTARHTQASLISFLENENVSYQSLFIINSIQVDGDFQLIETLAKRDDVARVLDNPMIEYARPVHEQPNNNRGLVVTWGIEMINANDVWALGYRGQGVTVGGADTGYEWHHPALINQYRGYDAELDTVDHNYNWHDAIHKIDTLNADSNNICGLDSPFPCDDRGHGTHTMGTMVGLDSINEIGVAPEAEWCGCRNMERGYGTPFTYLECFEWFLAPTDLNNQNPDPSLAPHVINNSWGCPKIEGCDSSNWHILEMAVNNLRQAGIVVVVSAGNDGPACNTIAVAPAFFEGSFSVGATAMNDTIVGFSSRGPVLVDGSNRIKPDVTAPGLNVLSSTRGGNYGFSSGTSMAGPHVVGLVALMISANPQLAGQVEIIEDIIEQTAVPKTTDQNCGNESGTEVPNNTYGYGRIDALAAVNVALALMVSTDDPGEESSILIYPNPADEYVLMDFKNYNGNISIQLFDANGRMMMHHSDTGGHLIRLELSDQPSGIYFYQAVYAGKIIQGKIMVH